MDIFSTHWGAFQRQFPMAFPLQTVGYNARKDDWVRTAYPTCNFSFIISGGGIYIRDGVTWKLEAPCVITQWPGEYLEYGPCGDFTTWEELYLVYRREARGALEQCGFIREDRPVWQTGRGSQWAAVLPEVLKLGRDSAEKHADRMDRLCERLILESLLQKAGREDESPHAGSIREIQSALERNLASPPDFSAQARAHGMSDSTFRREWARLAGSPPARYLTDLRIREACRQLVETGRPVGEIASAVGIGDALYFSRKFRQYTRLSPTQYRRHYT